MTRIVAVAALLVVALAVAPALAFDANQTFKQGNTVLSIEGGAGTQSNLQNHRQQSDLDAWYLGLRYSILPIQPAGPGFLRGSFEIGLEPTYMRYFGNEEAYWAGLSAQLKWHFLSLGRFVPYIEGQAGAGGTNLRTIEIDSSFAFLLGVGIGASYFITDQTAIYAGYRFLHVSNGNTDRPNRGFELDTGLVGFSYFFK
jgi:opacity protein-like surface antigen